MRRKRIRENKEENLKKTEEVNSFWSTERLEDGVESDGEDNLVIVEQTPQQEEIENPSVPVSLPINLYHDYLNHKSKMSRKPRSKGVDEANGTYDGALNPTNVTQPKRARSNSEFPNTDYQNILKNVYQAIRNTEINAEEMNLSRQYENSKKTDSVQEISNYGLPYLPNTDITIRIMPNNKEIDLRTKQQTLPRITAAEEYFEEESIPTENPLPVDVAQNIHTNNILTVATFDPDLESNVLNLSKPKDLVQTDLESMILTEDELNLVRLVRESQINIQTLITIVAKGDLNNNDAMVNDQNVSETIDLVDDDDDQGLIVDPKVLQALEDQSAANKKIISTMYTIAKAASGTELKSDVKSEIILSILNSDAPGVLSEQLTDYIKKIIATSKVAVTDKSTETIPIRMYEISENVELAPTPIQETEAKAVAPHCPSQEVHSLMCRPNHHHVRPGHTSDLIQQSAQMYVPQQATYSNNETVIRQNIPYRNKQSTQQEASYLHKQTVAHQAYPNKQMSPQQASYMQKQALTGASASYPNKQMMPPQNYGNGLTNYQTQNVMNPQPHLQTQNIVYQNNSAYSVHRAQHGAAGFYNSYPNTAAVQQHQHQQWSHLQYNAQRSRNRQHEVPQQNLGNLYW